MVELGLLAFLWQIWVAVLMLCVVCDAVIEEIHNSVYLYTSIRHTSAVQP